MIGFIAELVRLRRARTVWDIYIPGNNQALDLITPRTQPYASTIKVTLSLKRVVTDTRTPKRSPA